ncbi:hypothetical protein BHE74_00006750, partial [Ensete ventricosum]
TRSRPPKPEAPRRAPVVLFNICDCYVRRPDQAERVLGTLLGSVSDGVLEIKNSYAVPHNKSADQVCLIPCRISLHVGKLSFFLHLNLSSTCLAQVALDVVYHQNMYMSHRKVNPKEAIIGW